ncbi:MAG: hypothetical protein RR162_00290 [Oscillospiraceae bacterium]
MTKDLKYFMREQKNEIVTAAGPDTIKDENGKPIDLEIKVLGNAEIQKINDAYRKRSIALDKRGNPYIAMGEVVFKTDKDNARAVRHIIAEALVYPNLKDEKLMEFYKCNDITDMPLLVFPRSDEYAHVSKAVMAAQGLGIGATEDETLEAAKN